VLADVGTLATLPDREFRSGLAEVAKYALTLDPELLEALERDPSPLLDREPALLEEVVTRCVRAKAAVVAVDERDEGRRLVLNYGHTLGHALERLDAFAGRTHGEAISVGMVFAARLSELLERLQNIVGVGAVPELPVDEEPGHVIAASIAETLTVPP